MLTSSAESTSFSEKFLDTIYELREGDQIKICLQCGTCSGICPFGSWMDFTPRKLITFLRANTLEVALKNETLWMCVSCQACTEACPSKIPLTNTLMTLIKEEALLSGNVPAELQDALEYSQRYGNPLGESPRKRASWTKDLDFDIPILKTNKTPVEILWFVGDYASYHPRVQNITKAFAKILHTLEVDFGILGPEENSDGDSQRLAGERGLFEMLAEKNGRVFAQYDFKKIITTDPHAYNAIKNEYPHLGIDYPIQHHTEFLHEHIDHLKSHCKKELNAVITYHDPCYLGRANNIYQEPREVLKIIPGTKMMEMTHNFENSLCCGGGGGGMWLDGYRWEIAENRLSEWRVREAVSAQEEKEFSSVIGKPKRKKSRQSREEGETFERRIMVVACPYEPPRFEDAIKAIPEANGLVVKDITEVLVEAMDL